jgi:hypothetical protein
VEPCKGKHLERIIGDILTEETGIQNVLVQAEEKWLKKLGHVKEWIEHGYFMAHCRQMWSNIVHSHSRKCREAQGKDLAGNQNRKIEVR